MFLNRRKNTGFYTLCLAQNRKTLRFAHLSAARAGDARVELRDERRQVRLDLRPIKHIK